MKSFDHGPVSQSTTGELASPRNRQLRLTQRWLPYAAVVAAYASPQQSSGTHKPQSWVQIILIPLPRPGQRIGYVSRVVDTRYCLS
jgi:hypothetical protein